MPDQDVYSVKPEPVERVDLNVRYTRAKTSRKVFAKIIDLILFVLLAILFFSLTRMVVQSTDYYAEVSERLTTTQLNSGVYVENEDGDIEEAVTYYDDGDRYSASEIMGNLESVIDQFYSYAYQLVKEGEISYEDYQTMEETYDEYRLAATYNENNYLFIEDEDGSIIKNPSLTGSSGIYSVYTDDVYVPFIESYLKGFLLSYFPDYYDDTNYLNYMVILVELPIAVFLSSILVYLVPPLIFKRNRQTIGMKLYKIGLINQDLLAVRLKKYLVYAFFQIVVEIWLSFLTLAIPLIVSTTLMGFSKRKQDFPQYMTQTQEIDISHEKIYMTKEEAEIDNIKINKSPVQFRNTAMDEDK